LWRVVEQWPEQLNALQISGLFKSEYPASAGCKAVVEAGVVEASLTRLEMKVDSVIEYLCRPHQRVASTQVADLGVSGHELQRQCDSARIMQRAWRSRRLRRSQPAAYFKELHAAIDSETFSDKFTELVGSCRTLTLAPDAVDVRERQLFTEKEVPSDHGSSTPPAGHAKGCGLEIARVPVGQGSSTPTAGQSKGHSPEAQIACGPVGHGSSTPPADQSKGDGRGARASGSIKFDAKSEPATRFHGFRSLDRLDRSSSSLDSEARVKDDAEFVLLEQSLESCLRIFEGSIAGLDFEPHRREKALDDLAETGMATIQSSFKTKEGNLLLYRHFRRLHRTLRSRIDNLLT
jgi:hypothetical protein